MNTKNPSQENLEFLKQHRVDDEVFSLSNKIQIPIQKYFLDFKEWKGTPIADTYGNKVVIDYNGEPLFAELAVLRFFQENNWQGVWVDSYRRKYRIGLPNIVDPISIPKEKEDLIETIKSKTRKSGGCWDVFVWKDNQILFIELKRKKKDKIQDTQILWLEESLKHGLSPDNFALLEWSIG